MTRQEFIDRMVLEGNTFKATKDGNDYIYTNTGSTIGVHKKHLTFSNAGGCFKCETFQDWFDEKIICVERYNIRD